MLYNAIQPYFTKSKRKKSTLSKQERARIRSIMEASYQGKRRAANTLGEIGYELLPEESTHQYKTFRDPSTGEISIVFRGSKTKQDWINDLRIATVQPFMDIFELGKPKRIVNTKNKVKQLQSTYGDVNAYGHSLGGYLAEISGAKGQITTYNKYGLPYIGKQNKRQRDIRISNDIVSFARKKGLYNEDIVLKTPTWNPIRAHDIDLL